MKSIKRLCSRQAMTPETNEDDGFFPFNRPRTTPYECRLPHWMVKSLDGEAKRVGVTRQSIVKVQLAERLKAEQDGGV